MTTSLFNLKFKEWWCPNCKQYQWSDEPNAVCADPNCFGKPMYTVVYSMIDGKRITGNDELGSTSR